MNVVIRGDVNHIRIGKRSNIQDLTMVHVMRETHPTVIGDEVTIGHSAVIHGCTTEDRVLLGMHATLVTRIPASSRGMGRPGKVKRPLNEAELAEIRRLSQAYVNYRLDYAK